MANRIKESNITPGAVTSDKIAPGTVSASNISPGTITNTLIAPGTIANDRLANTGITINGTTIALGASGDISAGTDWQSVIIADGSTATTAVAGAGYFINTTSAAHTINLPSSPTQGDEVTIVDYSGTFGTNNVTVGRNGSNIDATASDGILSENRLNVRFVYVDSTLGWTAVFDKASGNYGQAYISATGGTITTSGDYKIHTFTGDGCFVVSSLGNPAGGGSVVDYLVVAGGGGGSYSDGGDSGAGAGAGGFREGKQACGSPHTASPLAATSGITVSTTTYPITVGGGGTGSAGVCQTGTNGSSSIFSTITSAGGGYAGNKTGPRTAPGSLGNVGGSGGGGAGGTPATNNGGSGNTPPVNPPQGNPGGIGGGATGGPDNGGGGGGGAGAAGQPNVTRNSSNPSCVAHGGIGVTTSISGSPTGYAGGGGGANYPAAASSNTNPASPYGGGLGGYNNNATDGSANTGGGAGGNSGPPPGAYPAKSGGKGIVVVRYKYQN